MSSTAASSAPDGANQRDSWIPVFSGQPSDYKEWRKRITLYHQKMVLGKRRGEAILNIVGSLTGTAWRLVEDFDVSKAEDESSFAELLKLLDGHFQYDDRVQLPADFDGYFGLSRKPNQTLLSFVSDHDECHRKLEKHNVSLPDAVQGWHLLRKANLTKEQRQLVTLRAPKMERQKVIEALYLLLGQDYKASHGGHGHHKPFHKTYKYRGYAAQDYETDETFDQIDADGYSEWADDGAYYGDDGLEAGYDDWDEASTFDANAAYYQYEHEEDAADDSQWQDVDVYDEAYAAYLDARKRFTDLRLSRGYLPIVALGDPAAGNISPGITSPTSSPTSTKGRKGSPKGKSKGGSPKGKPNNYKFQPAPMKQAEPKARAKAALRCLRCGQPGHFAANCPVPSKAAGTKRSAPATEAVAMLEAAHVTFQDGGGHERHDVAMLDPGASAFLCGYGPARRYLNHLATDGYPIDQIQFYSCRHKFHFGGDGESWCHWIMEMPMCVAGSHGRAQVFLLKGETPMLCGRPIIEALGLVMDFSRRQVKLRDAPWRDATIGLHGEYLLPLWEPDQPFDFQRSVDLDFDLRLTPDGGVDPMGISLEQFEKEETAFVMADEPLPDAPDPAESRLHRHQLRTMEEMLLAEHNQYHAYITDELHKPPRRRVVWEVYTGLGRVSAIAESLGADVEVFSLETGWNFDEPSHRRQFLARLDAEVPDELWLAPVCKYWSPMQSLAARTAEQQEELQGLREWHHATHLKFNQKAYETQVKNGAHAHLEQPAGALSWRTTALSKLPGYKARFDQCRYGAQCLDTDDEWKPAKKPTCVQTTKRAMFNQLQLQCQGDHEHCPLEGSSRMTGLRTRYMENYQPGLAGVIAAALLADEVPTVLDFAGAVNEERTHTGELVKLLAANKQDAVRTVQRLHRNLGHPETSALVELLASRGASEMVLEVARNYHCAACSRYKKPNSPSPASLQFAKKFNDVVQADVMRIKIGLQNVPILHVVDLASKFEEATVVHSEKTNDLRRALERRWFRIFGAPGELVTDEGRG